MTVNFITAVTKSLETVIGFRIGTRCNMWISETTWDLRDERKKIKLQKDHAKTLFT